MFSQIADQSLSTPAEPIIGLSVIAPSSRMVGKIHSITSYPLVEVITEKGHKFSTMINALRYSPTSA